MKPKIQLRILLALTIILGSCKKTTEDLMISSSRDDNTLKKPYHIDEKSLYYGGRLYTVYKRNGTSPYRPTALQSEYQAQILAIKQNRFFDTSRNFRTTLIQKGSFSSKSILIQSTELLSWHIVKSYSFDCSTGKPLPASPSGTYAYHETFYFDMTWPSINYRVEFYFNVNTATGEFQNGYIVSKIWGAGVYSDYRSVMDPPPYLELSDDGMSVYFYAEGETYPATNWLGANWLSPTETSYDGFLTLYYDELGAGSIKGICRIGRPEPHYKHQSGTGLGGL